MPFDGRPTEFEKVQRSEVPKRAPAASSGWVCELIGFAVAAPILVAVTAFIGIVFGPWSFPVYVLCVLALHRWVRRHPAQRVVQCPFS